MRHFKFTTALVKSISGGANIADLLNNAEQEGSITRQQMPPIISALLVDKFEYHFASRNITRMIESAEDIIAALAEWTDLQITVVYHHPEVGAFIINPREKNSWDPVLPILKDELITVYIQSLSGSLSDKQLNQALQDVHGVLAGFDAPERPEYRAKASAAKRAAPKPAATQPAPPGENHGTVHTGSPPVIRWWSPMNYSITEMLRRGNELSQATAPPTRSWMFLFIMIMNGSRTSIRYLNGEKLSMALRS
ncbi:hypothetical protein [Salinispira pacifica]|uniref:hypothetical protein n=1 Tax=Salinispira pacifica TaxID=1307761 RepID=UPI001FCAEE5F|nr:hypothetical protein [Salinispira pacifica]